MGERLESHLSQDVGEDAGADRAVLVEHLTKLTMSDKV